MGLFDRFKKKTKAAADSNEITIQADSDEAKEIIQKKRGNAGGYRRIQERKFFHQLIQNL